VTVTVRPVPKRAYQNGIRPFRPVVPTNNIRPYTLKTWKPPVPEPLPPAPLLGPKELLGLGLLVLAQIWGFFNRTPEQPQNTVKNGQIDGPFGDWGGTVNINGYVSGRFSCSTGAMILAPWTITANQGIGASGSYGIKWETTPFTQHTKCGGTDNNSPVVWLRSYKRTTPNGPWEVQTQSTNSQGEWRANFGFSQFTTYNPTPVAIRLNGVEQPLPTEGEPIDRKIPTPAPLPLLPVTPSPAPAVPSPAPQPEPLPELEPVPTTPGPKAPPATTPFVPQRTAPVAIPGATPTRDGKVLPQAPAAVPTTSPDAHYPVPGAPPVTGNGPRPTPEGIAEELGRLEQKLARLSNPATDEEGQGEDRLKLLRDNIGNILDFFLSMTSGGGYSISSPCETDENGDPVEHVVEYGGALQSLGVISNKIDALAALLQVHKNLKQPNCTPPKPVGQPVTVNFVQID